jgi:hypothetical protein
MTRVLDGAIFWFWLATAVLLIIGATDALVLISAGALAGAVLILTLIGMWRRL